MKALILGATGPTGRHTVRLAQAAHTVSAFVRDRVKGNFSPEVRIIEGNAFRPETIAAAVPGHDVVFSCLGAPLGQSFGPAGRPCAAAAGPLVEAMKASDVRRLISFLGGALAFAVLSFSPLLSSASVSPLSSFFFSPIVTSSLSGGRGA